MLFRRETLRLTDTASFGIQFVSRVLDILDFESIFSISQNDAVFDLLVAIRNNERLERDLPNRLIFLRLRKEKTKMSSIRE